jgi:hypothetical protein
MAQHGQVLKLRARRPDGKAVWAYRYRISGSRPKRPQVGGFATRTEAERALRRELARLRPGRQVTLAELVEECASGSAGDDREAAVAARESDGCVR